jgi:hypothetical protein
MVGMNFLHIQIEEEDVFLCQHSHSRRLIHISQYLFGPGVTPSDVKHQRALAIVGSTQRIEINVHLCVQDGTYEGRAFHCIAGEHSFFFRGDPFELIRHDQFSYNKTSANHP